MMILPPWKAVAPLVGAVLAVTAAVGLALVLRASGGGVPVQVLTLSLGVVAAGTAGWLAGSASAGLTVLAFNYWFTEPLYSFLVDDPQNYLVFGLFGVAGVTVGVLSDRLRSLAREQARHAEERQAGELFQGFSHDLRTPLAVIGGTADSLAATLADRLSPEELGRLATIGRETADLGRRLDNLLGFARLQTAPASVRWTVVPAEELLFSCRDRCSPWMPQRRLEVVLPDSVPLVRVDPSLMEQALLNLVENAHRYSAPEAEIVLGLEIRSSEVELTVGDRGPGVPDAEKRAIFEPFVRGAAAGGLSARGTGLGLALVARAAALHRGRTGCRDREGGGAEFWIRLATVSAAGVL